MRITNKMMTTNMQSNISRNKANMSVLGNQYSTGQKIQRPSEDPVVAVRSLKYRTQLSELNQYYEKNIPDALAWMDVTEGALDSVNDVLKSINTQCNEGSNDSLNVENRKSIIATLQQYKQQIYEQYGNTDYAGRYVFTGYRTDTPLLFNEATNKKTYTITENFSKVDITSIPYLSKEVEYSSLPAASDPAYYAAQAPSLQEAHRIRLSYGNLDSAPIAPATASPFKEISFSAKNAAGNVIQYKLDVNGMTATDNSTVPATVTTSAADKVNFISSSTANAYNPTAGINYIYDTGELIISNSVFTSTNMEQAENISVQYDKTEFAKADARPEHYFACTTADRGTAGTGTTDILYDAPHDQNIQYEVNFSQKLTVNTMACNSISLNIGRTIDEISRAANELEASETKLAETNKMIADPANASKLDALNELKKQLDTEIALKSKVLQNKFGKAITMTTDEQDRVNVALSDHGSRYVRLEMTESRLSTQQVDFKDMLQKNDGVNLEDIIIDYNAAQVTYNASLSSAAKVVTNTLLDFL